MLTILAPIALLSFCTGIMLIGTVLYVYVYSSTGTRLYLATVYIGALGIFYTGTDMLVVVLSVLGMDRLGMEFHRIEAIIVGFYLFALPYVFHHVLELTPALKRVNRAIYTTGLAVALVLGICAFVVPDLFLAFAKRPEVIPTDWNSGRAIPGVLYRIRDLLITILSLYSIGLMIMEIRLTRRVRHVIVVLVGLVIGIGTGVIDLLIAAREIETGLFSIRVFPLFCVGVTVFTVLSMISIMKLFLDQARALERMRKNEYLELLAGGIAHDFNNILTGVLASASLALEKTAPSDGTYGLLQDIRRASARAKDLSTQLLTFSRGGIIVKSLVSMTELIRETVQFSMAGSSIEVKYSLAPELMNAAVDAGMISQVLQNIVINAKQSMPSGGRLHVSAENVTITNRTPHLEAGGYVRIRFQDTGKGIPGDLLHAIFEPYFTTRPGGEGLGLAVSYSIVKKHHGHIEVSSRVNEGSVFSVYLPASLEKLSPVPEERVPVENHSGRVLLMDDEELILKIGANILKHLGFEPVCVKRGEDAISEYRASRESGNPFALVIMDLTITCGMGGIEAVKCIKEIDPAAKVIVSTGYAQDLTATDYTRFGFNGAILKPYTFEEFRREIERVCA